VGLQGGLLRSGGGRRLGSVELEVRRVCGSIGACGDAYHYDRDGNEDPVAKPTTCQYVLVLGLKLSVYPAYKSVGSRLIVWSAPRTAMTAVEGPWVDRSFTET